MIESTDLTVEETTAWPAPAGPSADGEAEARDRRALTIALVVVAVAVPLALFTWRALHAPVNFDGGMNLQVAQRLAHGEGYTRFYGELKIFPPEVQTNGPWMYLASLGILVFGNSQLGYQLSNLVFVAALAALVFVALREHPVLRVVGPSLTLLAIPQIPLYGLGGLGEVPATAFLLGSILALGAAVAGPQRRLLWVLVASASFGAAVATKTFSVGGAIALAGGLVCVLAAASTWRERRSVLLACGAAAVPLAIRELHRLASLGSVFEYRGWWSRQRTSISKQSGFDGGGSDGPIQTVLDHMHNLSRQVDFPAEVLVFFLAVPVVWVAAMAILRWRRDGLRATLRDPRMAVLLMLAALAAAYIGWWLLLVPERKLWLRRMIPGLVALHLLYLLAIPYLAAAARRVWRARADAPSAAGRLRAAGVVAAIALVAVSALPFAADQVRRNTRAAINGQPNWLDATEDAAAYVRDSDPNLRFFGDHWWSAPVVSLTAEQGFLDLSRYPVCEVDPSRDRLVWDYDAKTIGAPTPNDRGGRLVFEPVAQFGGFITIYSMAPDPLKCAGAAA